MNKILLSLGLLLALFTSCQKEISEDLPTSYLQTDSTRLLLPVGTGGKDSFRIKSNIQWQITVSPATADWFTTSITMGNGSIKVVVSVTKNNTSDTVQKAIILISPVNNSSIKPVSIAVSQNKPVVKIRNAYGGSNLDELFAAVATGDGGIIAVGRSTSKDGDVSGNKGQEDCWIIKTDANGNKVWQKTLGGSGRDAAFSIAKTNDGNYFISAGGSVDGDFAGMGADDSKIFKIDDGGNIIWKKSLPIGGTYTIIPAAGGGYMLAGGSGGDFSVTKTDENLVVVWQKKYGGSGYEGVSSIVAASDNGYILAGYSDSNDGAVSGNKGASDFWVIKIDQNGSLVWQKSYGGTSREYCNSMAKAQDGGYVIVGYTESKDGDIVGHHGNSSMYSNDEIDGWVIKIDANGNKVWAKTIGGTQADILSWIIPAQGGGFLISGYSRSKDGDITNLKGVSDALVVKMGENGAVLWSKNPGGNDEESGDCILEPSQGNYVLIGTTFSNNGDVVGLHGYGDGWIYKFN